MAEIKGEDLLKIVLPDYTVTDESTIEDVQAKFNERYVGLDLHQKTINDLTGKVKGSAEIAFKNILNKIGVPATEYSGKKMEEIISLSLGKVEELTTQIEELKKGTGGDTDKVKLKIEGLEKQLNDYKTLISEKDGRINELDEANKNLATDAEKKYANLVLNQEVIAEYNGANWTDDSDDIVKEGVKAKFIDGKVTFQKDGNQIFVYDAEGNMMKDGVNQMTAAKFFENVLKTAKRFKENKGNPDAFKKTGNQGGEGTKKSQAQLDYEKSVLELAEKQKTHQG